MHIPDNVICKVCNGVFCCAECRRKHEIKNHAIPIRKPKTAENNTKSESQFETIYILCPICDKRPLPLQAEMPNEILIHIESNHLPLRCGKCSKMYYNIDDLKEFTKCFQLTAVCPGQESLVSNSSCHTNELSKVTVTKATIPHGVTVVQNSPMCRQDFNESHMTPISIINMRWKAKSKLTHEEIISDSVSSIKNISSINNSSIRHTMGTTSGVKGKVIRCSSTPVHFEMLFSKPKEQTFNASSGGHISSIQYNSGCESDISPAFPQPNSQALERNRYIKVPGSRSKISTVTPLHQVMSKSIQKAFAEHGLPSTSIGVRGSNAHQRKKMFDSTSSPDNITESPQPPALDLRLSPAIRRCQSEGEEYKEQRSTISGIAKKHTQKDLPNLRRKIILSAQKLTTESIVITRTEHMSTVSSSTSSAATSNGSINSVKPISSTNSSYQSTASNNSGGSVFKSCSSVEIIRATTEQIQTLESENAETHSTLSPFTPITRIPGPPIIQKKLIKFDTPNIKSYDVRKLENSPSDVFFTPNATPMSNQDNESTEVNKERKLLVKQNLYGRFSPLRRPSIKECAHSTAFSRIENITNDFDDDPTANVVGTEYDDEVFLAKQTENKTHKISENKKTNEPQQSSGLWSLMTSMMRLPSRIASQSKDDSKKTDAYAPVDANSIMKRCASIAGCLVRSKPLVDESELRSLKRKRTYTTDNQTNSTFLSQYNNSITTSPNSDNFNISSKRFRIQGRRPIDRMRLNS